MNTPKLKQNINNIKDRLKLVIRTTRPNCNVRLPD